MTLDSFNAFTVTVTPQSVLWKFFDTVLFFSLCVNILDLDQARRLSGLGCVKTIYGNVLWCQPKLLPPIQWVAASNSLEPYQAQLYVGSD